MEETSFPAGMFDIQRYEIADNRLIIRCHELRIPVTMTTMLAATHGIRVCGENLSNAGNSRMRKEFLNVSRILKEESVCETQGQINKQVHIKVVLQRAFAVPGNRETKKHIQLE
jgi:hypothetical protein